ncbi:hypothetical protein JG688_00008268 [Phytophthora aleatoria]|uniref:Ubiquitin carboxyl-terminal hydrolase n=1 Tax=Phytophthora aleatoria TaxID=2496075 RepID=A0A8J5M4S2_9STRA|nr:hypothetical protein JG688_00008268 [Phytophthora aleatoria]
MTEPFSFASVLNPWQETQDENVVSNHHPQQHIESSRNRRRNPDPFGKPSELLQQIGLRGKEVVNILKERDWDVCDPKALQEHKLYYVPGGRAKGELAVQGEDFFVGEGELYAYILDKGEREDSGLHEGVHQELKVLSSGIKASQNDLSSMIAVIIQQAERIHSPERSGNLMLMRDMERHLLLIVAALNIEKINAELTELSTIISAQAETLSQKNPITPMELDADVETDTLAMAVPGLQNLGNTCFFNAILQALASLPSVHEFLEEIDRRARVERRRIAFTGALRDCLEALAPHDTPCVVAPRILNAELTSKLRAFRGNKQQDAQELLQFLFKLVGGEQRHCGVQDRGLVDLNPRDNVPICDSISDLRLTQAVNERSWNPLQGLQVNLLQCARCRRFRPLNNQPFLDVSLSLVAPGDKKVSRLTDALRLYTEAEVIKDVECSYCSVVDELEVTRKEYTQAVKEPKKLRGVSGRDVVELELAQHELKGWIHTLEQLANSSTSFDLEQLERPIPRSRGDCFKRLQFSRSPDVFCFHFNRKVYMRTGGAVKLETYVEFPLELDMDDYCQYETSAGADSKGSNGGSASMRRPRAAIPTFGEATKQQYLLYDLTAVILHHGNERCGHFTAYRRASPSQWFFVSDDNVREAPVAEVLKSCAYMLFYERKYRTKRTTRSSETEETTDDDDSLPDVPFEPHVLLPNGRF